MKEREFRRRQKSYRRMDALPKSERTCRQKTTYKNDLAADKAIKIMEQTTKLAFTKYSCTSCCGLHIARVKVRRPGLINNNPVMMYQRAEKD